MQTQNNKNLFETLSVRGLTFQNRIVMAPMTRARAIGSVPNDLMALYYSQRATAGLIITEGTAPSPNGLGYARIPGIYNEDQVDGWKKVTRAVHKEGGKIFVQLMHVGRVAHSANLPEGAEIIAPSAITANGDMWTDSLGMQKMEKPQAMTTVDIEHTIEEFVRAAKNAVEAGFDGVELHAANGYLPEQFINPNSNTRTDAYGGSIEKRSRFILSLTRAAIDAIGRDKVGIRLSPYSTFNDMKPHAQVPETYTYLAKELQKLDVLYIHLIDFGARSTIEGLNLISSIRREFKNLLILNGDYDKQKAEDGLEKDGADLISFGSKFIANPDLPYKLQHNIPLNLPDTNSFYTPDASGYTDYPATEIKKTA